MCYYIYNEAIGRYSIKMRRFFAAVLAAAMLLSFAGCAVKDTLSESSSAAVEQTTE